MGKSIKIGDIYIDPNNNKWEVIELQSDYATCQCVESKYNFYRIGYIGNWDFETLQLHFKRKVDVGENVLTKSQIGGSHYTDLVIQPDEYAHKNNLNFMQGNAIKYITRYKHKGGKEDLEKAISVLKKLIKFEYE